MKKVMKECKQPYITFFLWHWYVWRNDNRSFINIFWYLCRRQSIKHDWIETITTILTQAQLIILRILLPFMVEELEIIQNILDPLLDNEMTEVIQYRSIRITGNNFRKMTHELFDCR
jgi:hypothetical protein